MKNAALQSKIALIQKKWRGLRLETMRPLDLSDQDVGSIIAGTDDPVPLVEFTPDAQTQIFDFASWQTSLRQYYNDHGASEELVGLARAIESDFSRLAAALLKVKRKGALEIEAGLYERGRVLHLHVDGRASDGPRNWNIITRIGALPTWVARKENLARADKKTVDAASSNRFRNPRSISARGQQQALEELKKMEILEPLDLGKGYLISAGTSRRGGCRHVSSFVSEPTHSCFIRYRCQEKAPVPVP